jgi:hypothetical protein
MDKKKFIKLINKTLNSKYNENSSFNPDSFDMLKIVEMNDKFFKKKKINFEKILECKNIKSLIKIYNIK